jgi:MFS family permease
VGAALAALGARSGRAPEDRVAIGAFAGVALAATALFAAGRFGADVGAAIVFPAGAAVAIAFLPGMARRRGLVLLLLAAPLAGLAVLALIDLVLGGDAHLSRSVFEAGGADDLADVAERRLRLSASSFENGTERPLFWVAVALIVAAVILRRRIAAWLGQAPLVRAGVFGAAAGVVLGTVANDSGATFLTIGTIALTACLAFAWSRSKQA